MRKYVVWLLLVSMLAVLGGASFAGDQPCPVCGGDGEVNCHECNGSGRCPFCGGDGKLGYVPSYGYGQGEDIICSVCGGDGRCSNCHGNRTERCTRCNGSGTIYAPDSSNDDGSTTEPTTPTDDGGSTPSEGDTSSAPSIKPSIDTNLSARIGEGYIGNNQYNGSIYQYVEAENGTAPFKWTVSKGTFPPGLGLFPGDHGNNMVIDEHSDRFLHFDGIPTTSGTYNFTLKVTDAQGRSAEKDYTMTVEGDDFDSGPTIVSKYENDTLPSPEYVRGYFDDYYMPVYTALFAEVSPAPRNPYTWKMVAGTLPQGMRFEYPDGDTGRTATVKDPPEGKGTFTFLMKVTDGDGRSARKTFYITVEDGPADDPTANGHVTLTDDPDPEISGSFSDGLDGQQYSSRVSASGGTAPYTWSVIEIDGLREQMQLANSGLSLAASDSETYASAGNIGKYAYLTGSPKYQWGGGYYTFILKVTDAKGNTNAKTFTLHIAEQEQDTTPSPSSDPEPEPTPATGSSLTLEAVNGDFMEDAQVGMSYFDTVVVSGGKMPYEFELIEGTVPDGLEARIYSYLGEFGFSGRPTKAGTFTFTLKVTDSEGATGQGTFSIKVAGDDSTPEPEPEPEPTPEPEPEPTPTPTPDFDFAPDSTDETLGGDTPTVPAPLPDTGTDNTPADDQDDSGSTRAFAIDGDLPAEGVVMRPYTGELTTHKYNTFWYVIDGKLPTGLENVYSGISGTASFLLRGLPQEAGTFTFTVRARHVVYGGEIESADKTFTITIAERDGGNTDTPTTNNVSSSGGGGGGCNSFSGLGVMLLAATAFRKSRR